MCALVQGGCAEAAPQQSVLRAAHARGQRMRPTSLSLSQACVVQVQACVVRGQRSHLGDRSVPDPVSPVLLEKVARNLHAVTELGTIQAAGFA
jgi:hypothetical protein